MAVRKVLFVHYVPNKGGAATSMFTLIRHLDPKRYQAEVLMVSSVIEPIATDLRGMGIPVHHVPLPLVWDQPWYSMGNLRSSSQKAFRVNEALRVWLMNKIPDIVHINDFLPVSAAYTAKALQIPIVWHCRSVIRHCRPWIDPGANIIAEMNRLSDVIIAISESEAQQYQKEKIRVLFNPLEFERTEAALIKPTSKIRSSLSLLEDDFVIMAPIPLSKNKGAWDFIKAAGLLKKHNPNKRIKYLLVGLDGGIGGRRHLLRKWTGCVGPRTARQTAEYLLDKYGIRADTQILGYRQDIYEIMHASDLIVFPSRLKACGRACFEAGAVQKPIIVTMPSNNTRVVMDGKTGLILPDSRPDILAEGIQKYVDKPELGRKMGNAGYVHVKNAFDPDRYALSVMDIYDTIIKKYRVANS